MVSFVFSRRLIFDKHFFDEWKNKKAPNGMGVFSMLMYINDRAKGYSRSFNAMSGKCFDKILAENNHMLRPILRSFFKDFRTEEIELINDEVERTIKLSIDLLDESPNASIILTSTQMQETYESNPHYKGVKEINVLSGDAAISLIVGYFSDCKE